MTRIAQVLAGAAQGGAESFFVRLLKGLQGSDNLQQRAFVRHHPQRVQVLREAGIETECFRLGGPLDLLDRRRFVQALRGYQPDVVVTWMNRGSRVTPRGEYRLVSRLGNYYDLKYHRHADFWVGISKGICDYLVQGGMPAERVFHIPNFADESAALPLDRRSFETLADSRIILAAGRLHRDKAFDTLLRALVSVPDTTLWLAGTGPEDRALRELAETLGIEDRVRFLGWRNDVAALMSTADLFVCSSRHEGLGSIVLEAWAHQCPIVATASQGPGELIEDGLTGSLTPVDEPAPLAAAIMRLLDSPAEREKLCLHAAAQYRRYFSEAVVVDQYRQFFYFHSKLPLAGL